MTRNKLSHLLEPGRRLYFLVLFCFAGASAVQLYTAMVYRGISLVPEIARGLDALLARGGFANVAMAVGTGRSAWL